MPDYKLYKFQIRSRFNGEYKNELVGKLRHQEIVEADCTEFILSLFIPGREIDEANF